LHQNIDFRFHLRHISFY